MLYFMGRGWMMRNLALISLLIIAAIGWMRPVPDRVTDHYFIDQNNQLVQYDKPSWVTGEVSGYEYEGRGIYRIEFNSGWIVRVNRLGVVWRTEEIPVTPFQIGVLGFSLVWIGVLVGIITAVTVVRSVRASHRRAKEAEEQGDRIWEAIKKVERQSAATDGVIDVEPDGSGVFR